MLPQKFVSIRVIHIKINLKLKFQIRQEEMFPDNLIVKLHVFYVLQKKISEIDINSRNDDFLTPGRQGLGSTKKIIKK